MTFDLSLRESAGSRFAAPSWLIEFALSSRRPRLLASTNAAHVIEKLVVNITQ